MGKKSRKKREVRTERPKGQVPKERKQNIFTVKDLPIHFTKKNYIGFALGIVIIVLGFISLSYGSITLAPILLVLGYCVIIPVAILLK
jgi:hypothetical protein